jgi:hypothetical protein
VLDVADFGELAAHDFVLLRVQFGGRCAGALDLDENGISPGVVEREVAVVGKRDECGCGVGGACVGSCVLLGFLEVSATKRARWMASPSARITNGLSGPPLRLTESIA